MMAVRALRIILVVGLAAVGGRGVVQARGNQLATIDDHHGMQGAVANSINLQPLLPNGSTRQLPKGLNIASPALTPGGLTVAYRPRQITPPRRQLSAASSLPAASHTYFGVCPGS